MATDLNFYQELYNKISISYPVFSNEDYTIVITPSDLNSTKEYFQQFSVDYDIIQQTKLAIDIDTFPFKLFWNDDFYYKKVTESAFFENDILILNIDNGAPCRLYHKHETFIDFISTSDNWFFKNSFSYLTLLDLLSEQNEKHDDVFHFIDDFSKSTGRSVFTSAKDFGKLIIKFKHGILELNEQVDYTPKITKFKECFLPENKHLPKFLKNELFNFLAKEKEQERVYVFFEKLDEIVNTANLNFEVYLNDLSLESLKKDYNDYKQKYFIQLNDFLNSLTNKIIALPITISAVLFSITKVAESTTGTSMLIVALFITCFYLFGILRINVEDLKNIEETFKRDYKQFSNSSFFIKFPDEEQYFKAVKRRIESKIGKLDTFVKLFYWITALSHSALIIYCFSFLFSFSLSAIAILGIISFFISTIIYQYYITDDME